MWAQYAKTPEYFWAVSTTLFQNAELRQEPLEFQCFPRSPNWTCLATNVEVDSACKLEASFLLKQL